MVGRAEPVRGAGHGAGPFFRSIACLQTRAGRAQGGRQGLPRGSAREGDRLRHANARPRRAPPEMVPPVDARKAS